MNPDNQNPLLRARVPRLSFADDEVRHAWLKPYLTACAIVDAGVTEAVSSETAKGRRLACHQGCSACCRVHTTIPVYPLELIGMTWYAVEKITGETREKLNANLRAHRKGEPCPLLVDSLCSVHALRPLACRQFNVFGKVCEEGEDAHYTRREDVLTPIPAFANAAFETMLPFYGVNDPAKQKELIDSGKVHQLARVLQEYDWAKLAERMEVFDRSPSRVQSPVGEIRNSFTRSSPRNACAKRPELSGSVVRITMRYSKNCPSRVMP